MSLLRGNCFISALRLRGKQKKQKWVGRYREDVVKVDGSIKRTRHSVVLGTKAELPTERLARRRLDEILSRVNSPEYRPGRISTVKEFSEWWKSQVLVQLKPPTIRAAQAHLRCHIVPHLGKLKLDEVTLERQQVFVTQLSQTVSSKTVRNVIGTLSSLLTRARKQQYFASTEDRGSRDARRRCTGRGEMFQPEEVRQIIKLAEEPFRTMFRVLAMTGIRADELFGLTVDDPQPRAEREKQSKPEAIASARRSRRRYQRLFADLARKSGAMAFRE